MSELEIAGTLNASLVESITKIQQFICDEFPVYQWMSVLLIIATPLVKSAPLHV